MNQELPHLQRPIEDMSVLTHDMLFSEYIAIMRKRIIETRLDLGSPNAAEIIDANCPFEWQPNISNPKNGVLLVHGLYDSPFTLRDLGQHFLSQDYLVRSILLPGHGTVPGDLLNVGHHDWLDTVQYGIERLATKVDNVILCAFSLGTALCILRAHTAKNIRAMVLIAPALKTKRRFSHITRIHRLFTWISEKAKWYQISEHGFHAKYHSHPYHAGRHTIIAMNKASRATPILPCFATVSEDDETVDAKFALNYFQQLPHPQNKMVYYAKENPNADDPRVEWRSSIFPRDNIIDFSHPSLPIAPNNEFFGRDGKWLDFSHYRSEEHKSSNDIRLGAINSLNLSHYTMQRLSYNPDFENLMKSIDEFLDTCL